MSAFNSFLKITCNERKQIFDKLNLMFKEPLIKLELLEEIINYNKNEIVEYEKISKEQIDEILILEEIKIMEKYNKLYDGLIKKYYKKQEEIEMNKIMMKSMDK